MVVIKYIMKWINFCPIFFVVLGCNNKILTHNTYIDFIFPQPVDSIMTLYYDVVAQDKKLLDKQIIEWNPQSGWESYILLTVDDRPELKKNGEVQNHLLYIKNRTNRFFVIGNKYKIPIFVGCIDGICAYGKRKYPLPSGEVTYDLAPIVHLYQDSMTSNWKIINDGNRQRKYIEIKGMFADNVFKWDVSKYR